MTAPRAPLRVVDSGQREPALVFLHHFAGSSRAWNEVIAALSPQRRCLALDLRGFGRSLISGVDLSIDGHVADVSEAIAAADVKTFVLVGHSMGGKIAWGLAAGSPAGLRGLVLLAPSPPTPEPMSGDDREEQLAAFGDAQAARELSRRVTAKTLTSALEDRFVEDSTMTESVAWTWWLLHGSRENISARRPPAAIPALVLLGSADTVIPAEAVRQEVVARLDNGELRLLPGDGHLLPYEAALEVARHLDDFCRRIAAHGSHWTPGN